MIKILDKIEKAERGNGTIEVGPERTKEMRSGPRMREEIGLFLGPGNRIHTNRSTINSMRKTNC